MFPGALSAYLIRDTCNVLLVFPHVGVVGPQVGFALFACPVVIAGSVAAAFGEEVQTNDCDQDQTPDDLGVGFLGEGINDPARLGEQREVHTLPTLIALFVDARAGSNQMTDIYIARHGETTSNRAGLWQGATDSDLTATGQEQIRRLGARLGSRHFDTVIASDLGRAQSTAAALGFEFEASAAWREPDLGVWEGKTYEEVSAMSPEDLAGFMRGEDVRLGGADRLSETAARLVGAYRDVIAAVGPDGSALVVSHGLAIAVLTGVLLSTRRPNPLALPGNTGVLHLSSQDGKDRLHVHNDTTHLIDPPISFRGGTEVVLIRHGQTQGNLDQRWQGQQDGALTDLGREQAKEAVDGLPTLDFLYSSNLGRAIETAEIIGAGLGLTPEVVAGVEEFAFGDWEGMTHEEIRDRYPDEAHQLFDLGHDIVRGRTGETWARLRARVSDAVHRLAELHPGKRIGVVSHGGATRAFANEVLEQDFASRGGIVSMRNTAFATFGVTPKQVRILEWNIAPHLDR